MSDKYNQEDLSVIQKIQNKTGCLFLVIGVAMLAFVLTDLLGSGSSIFGSNENNVGSINGESITYNEFDQTYKEMKTQVLKNNPGIVMDDNMSQQYRGQAWNTIIESKLLLPEYEKLGINLSTAELEDLTIGNNTHPQIQQSFMDPSTNQFDKNRLIRFLKEDVNASPEAKDNWESFQKQFTTGLIAEKYNALVASSFYTTSIEARIQGNEDAKTVYANVVSLPYSELTDSTISASNSDILAYAKQHRTKYERDASRDIEYIKLNVIPSQKDSVNMEQWAGNTVVDFKKSTDDSAFVGYAGGESLYNPTYRVRGSFSPNIENSLFSAETGTVVGPFQQNGVYSIFKISDIGIDSLRSVRASHILFSISGTDTASAETSARNVLSKIKKGESTFEQEASSRNFDATRATGGDMGWIREDNNNYPPKLAKRLFNSGNGNYVIVRTKTGVHLAKATSNVSRKTVKVAVVDRTIYASSATDKKYYGIAGDLITQVNSENSFEEVAEKLGLTKGVASQITEEQRNIPGLSNSSQIARWLFNPETNEGDLSNIIDIDGSYIVARLSKVRSQGLPDADDLRGEIESIVLNKKKAALLLPKVEAALAKTKTAEELSKELGANVAPLPAAGMNTGSIPGIGQDQVVIGAIAGTPVGGHSGAIEGDGGVSVVYINNENESAAIDIAIIKQGITSQRKNEVQRNLRPALMDAADVKDQRYKFYD